MNDILSLFTRLRINSTLFFYRIYSEEEYKTLERYSTPELQRVPLDSSLLQMIAMGLPDARKFPFIEPPPADSIENAILSLKDHVSILDLAFLFFCFLCKMLNIKLTIFSPGCTHR